MDGYIKLHRKIIEWGWWDDPNVFRLFTYLLLTVNWETKSWHGRDILPGQLVTSLAKMAQGTGLTLSQVRTCLDKLKLTNEIAHETTQHYSVVTISKWALYQSDAEIIAQKTASKVASKSHLNRISIATTKELKKERTKEGASADDDLPPWMKDELDVALDAFKEWRAKKRSPVTPSIEELIRKKLEKMAPGDLHIQSEIVNQSMANGWTGLYPIKTEAAQAEVRLNLYEEG